MVNPKFIKNNTSWINFQRLRNKKNSKQKIANKSQLNGLKNNV